MEHPIHPLADGKAPRSDGADRSYEIDPLRALRRSWATTRALSHLSVETADDRTANPGWWMMFHRKDPRDTGASHLSGAAVAPRR